MNGNAAIWILVSVVSYSLTGFTQEKFTLEMLQNPGMHSEAFEALFELVEIPVFEEKVEEDQMLLENGYASYEFQNPNEWSPQGNEMIPLEVTVIFTKYPKSKEFWLTDYHWLLARRLEALFKLDPRFNSKGIPFKILLQTDCDNEPEAMQLFHGMLVTYAPLKKPEQQETATKPVETEEQKKQVTRTSSAAEKRIERFMKKLPEFKDSTVYHVLERNPWQDAVLVIDWTGSMYGYGAQGLMWHAQHDSASGIERVVMFNDGDRKKRKKKVPGYTGGIYAESAQPPTRPLKLMNKVKNRGDGGDSPENDIEALYTAMIGSPPTSEVIMIADNRSCIRDYALIRSLQRPIRIILCGTKRGINPQYLNLAWQTGGSIHTDSLDLYNLREMAAKDSLLIMDTRYTLTVNNLLMPVDRQSNAFKWCDRYYQLSPRDQKRVRKQQKRKDPDCYVF